jgi:hypothetical protein
MVAAKTGADDDNVGDLFHQFPVAATNVRFLHAPSLS